MSTRPTLRQLANGNVIQQWSCGRCGCRLWWVIDSRFMAVDGSRRRTRECRQCHQTIHTIEKPVSTCSEEEEMDVDK